MKHILTALALTLATARANFTLDWSTMDAGTGSGTAGTFAMQSTLGQPDAVTGSAGLFSFLGGYWSLPGEDEAAPELRMFRSGNNLVLAWPQSAPGWVLQSSTDLVSWFAVAIAPTAVTGEYQVLWGPLSNSRVFFRLHRP